MQLVEMKVKCTCCKEENELWTGNPPVKGYKGTILKCFWCNHCGEPQAVRFKFTKKGPKVTSRVNPNDVHIPREPETGIVIKPRARKPGKR